MARTTRSSQASKASPKSATKAGTKRSAETGSSPAAKREKTSQKTIEETMDVQGGNEDDKMDGIEDDADVAEQIDEKHEANGTKEDDLKAREAAVKKREDAINQREQNGGNGDKNDAEKEQDTKTEEISKNNNSVIEDDKREAEMPSSIMEKGIIYFFFRSRVNIEEPQGIEDVARSYIVLRPLPVGAKIGEGPLQDDGNARLLALPKKTLPKSKRDRFLTFVEKPKASIKDLRDQFSGSEYATKTAGTSHQQAATPFAEGIYALTFTGSESHLAYSITYPEIGEIQKELGLNAKGSYILSVKNPNAPGPANTRIANPAKYPESIQKKFRDLRWSPLEPEMLDYEGAQLLIIGEGMGNLGKAVEELSQDKEDEKEKPEEEIEKMEDEDHDRVEGLKEDDPVFADLGMSSKEYPKMQTTW